MASITMVMVILMIPKVGILRTIATMSLILMVMVLMWLELLLEEIMALG